MACLVAQCFQATCCQPQSGRPYRAVHDVRHHVAALCDCHASEITVDAFVMQARAAATHAPQTLAAHLVGQVDQTGQMDLVYQVGQVDQVGQVGRVDHPVYLVAQAHQARCAGEVFCCQLQPVSIRHFDGSLASLPLLDCNSNW